RLLMPTASVQIAPSVAATDVMGPTIRRAAPGTRAHAGLDAARSLSLAALAWGALAFGAVYAWAYWPLMLACGTAGLIALASTSTPGRLPRALWITFGL